MDLGTKIFIYCERGQDPSFWAEPLNALTNAAFIFAAVAATRDYYIVPPERRRLSMICLIAITYVIAIGSFLFHTYATRWAQLADMIPIATFVLVYLGVLLRRFIRMHWWGIALGLVAFFVVYRYAQTMQCEQGALLPITARAGARCLNGTIGYIPAFVALVLTTAGLAFVNHPAWKTLGAAAGVFFLSMTFRTLDLELCELTALGGHLRGTHFLWHTLNALTIYLLLRAMIRYGAPPLRTMEVETPPPDARTLSP
jgi:hypothetical protein